MRSMFRLGATLLIECCALYLLSVLALLFGVYSAMSSPYFAGAGVAADMPLWSVTHAYDLALLAVLGFLFAVPKRREDGYYVAMAAVALTLDPTLFTYRFYTHDLSYGLGMGAFGWGLALLKMAALAWICKVPLTRRNLASLAVVHALVYLGHAPFNAAGFSTAPYLYGLAFTPLVLAFLAPGPDDFEAAPEDITAAAQVRAGEFRWVMFALPFFGVALHLSQIPSVYDLASGALHWGPSFLAIVVLIARFHPDQAVPVAGLFGLAAVASLATTATPAGTFSLDPMGFALTPFRLMLLAHAGVSAYLALRYRLRGFEAYAAFTGILFLGGASPAEIVHAFWGPLGWASLSAYTGYWAYSSWEYKTATSAWISTSGLVACLATGDVASLWTAHLVGVGCVGLQHAFPEELEENVSATVVAIYVLLAHAYLSAGDARWATAETARLGLEAGLLVAGALFTPLARYRSGVGAGMTYGVYRVIPWVWLIEHEAVLGLSGAFGFLGAGFWVSLNKEALLEGLEVPAPARAEGDLSPSLSSAAES